MVAGRACAWPAIARLRGQLAEANGQLRRDPLTGLLNRTGLTEAYETHRQTRQVFTAALVDLDGFKAVNDTHGHDVGDQLLIVAAGRIDTAATVHGGITARLAGDEFVVLLPVRDEDLDRPVELILDLVAAPATVGVFADDDAPVALAVTASAGVCRAEPGDALEVALRRADVAMYHAKRRGGARHVHYAPGMTMPSPPRREGPRLRDRRDHGQVPS
jgi:diguanylate cyclase (GGDEF)-like protein